MSTLLILTALVLADSTDSQTVIVVVGAPGAAEYQPQFQTWADRWALAADKTGARFLRVGQAEHSEASDRDLLRELLAAEPKTSQEPLWLVLIGHGTFEGDDAKFNVRGPDFSAKELAGWLQPFQRPVAVINCASSSGPFVNRLSASGRVVVTATKSGYEQSFARFGDYLSAAITDPAADLDKDGQTSLLEAFLFASGRVEEFYAQESRLATEHALLDDNGDGLATPATWFRGVRATRTAKAGAKSDGQRANQFHLIRSQRESQMPAEVRTRRDRWELEIAQLREQKGDLDENQYYDRLKPLLLQLARLYDGLETTERTE